ncbi:MAG: hypothetical protein Q6361_03335, partial [Candidatus Hermodarchaeota archaeon]|nr:hypothetical protein [Candidatus Hermodarchaeota archaeon]
IFLIIFGVLIYPAVATVFYFSFPDPTSFIPLYSYHQALLFFNQFLILNWVFFSLPAIVVLIAGGSVQVFNYLIRPQPVPTGIRESPMGIRTSHGLVAASLHREQDRTRETADR